jgi:hypothetical protein
LRNILTDGEWRRIEGEVEQYYPPEGKSRVGARKPAVRPPYYALRTLMRLRGLSQPRAIIELAVANDLLAEFGSLCELPAKWSWLEPDSDCLRLADPGAALQSLIAEFPREALVAARVAVEDPEGNLQLNRALVTDGEPFIVLWHYVGRACWDVVTAEGCLAGAFPVLQMTSDEKVYRAVQGSSDKSIYGCFSLVDLRILRSLGVAAVLATKLGKLSGSGLDRLLRLVGGRAEPKALRRLSLPLRDNDLNDSSSNPWAVRLVLVAASLTRATAEIPGDLINAALHLAGAERHLGLHFPQVQVWYPTSQELDCLEYCRRVHLPEALRDFFHDKEREYHPLAAFQEGRPPALPTSADRYHGLLNELRRVAQEPYAEDYQQTKRRTARVSFHGFVERHFVRPAVEQAMKTDDPQERILLVQLADDTRQYYRIMAAIAEDPSQGREEGEGNLAARACLAPEIAGPLEVLRERIRKTIQTLIALRKAGW